MSADKKDIIYSKVLERYIEIVYHKKLHSLSFVLPGKHLKEKKTNDATFELENYFNGMQTDFSSDVDLSNLSPFEQKVLTQTRTIKYGKTITYSELAEKIGSRAYRAVGNALSKNPVPIIIPCHRVVAKKGMGGYSQGLEIKTRLLELEKRNLNNL
jgi:methylated-DNA-[protein]-cysteine S-methyltransferase